MDSIGHNTLRYMDYATMMGGLTMVLVVMGDVFDNGNGGDGGATDDYVIMMMWT